MGLYRHMAKTILRQGDPLEQGTGITVVMIERRSSAWRPLDVRADAWHDDDIAWDRDVLFALLEGAGSGASPFPSAEMLVRRIVPVERLRSMETIGMTSQGDLQRGPTTNANPGLIAWTVACLWGHDAITSALVAGQPIARYRVRNRSTDVNVCLPLPTTSSLLEVVVIALEADDWPDAIAHVSRLTLVRHLWAVARPVASQVDDSFSVEASRHGDASLTSRQQAILMAMADGLTNAQIARLINFSESTVRAESMAIYRHFAVHSRADAVVAARLSGELEALVYSPEAHLFDM